MLSFIARRLGLLIPTFFGVTLLTFALIRLIPGDPVEVMMGERRVDPQMHAEALHRLGLDKPLYQQYLDYVGNLAQGNLGESLTTREGVWHEFLTLFPATLELSLAAMLFAGTFGLLAGVIAALKRGSLFDHGVMTVSLAGYSMPIFWWGLILIMLFSVSLGWTPVSGRLDLLYDIEPNLALHSKNCINAHKNSVTHSTERSSNFPFSEASSTNLRSPVMHGPCPRPSPRVFPWSMRSTPSPERPAISCSRTRSARSSKTFPPACSSTSPCAPPASFPTWRSR